MNFYKKTLHGWGRYPIAKSFNTDIYYPIKNLKPFDQFNYLTPRGMGRSYGDASLAAPNSLVLDCSQQNKFLNFDQENGTIEVMAGVTLQDILDVIIPHGWFLPIVPGTRSVSIGGAIASNIHGKNHHKTGSISHFIKTLEVLTEKGIYTCSADENSDLFYSTAGGYGLTGYINKATISLRKIETSLINSTLIKAKNFQEIMSIFKDSDNKYEHSVAWIDCLSKGKNLGRGIAMLGNHLTLNELPEKLKKDPLKNKWKTAFTLPDIFPDFTLNPLSIKLFNFAYYNKSIKKQSSGIMNFENWFFPLDFFSNWNILYGNKGFTQYQCAIPYENGEKGIQATLEYLSKMKIGSFLAVLKVVKADEVDLPFATPGYTLALDIPLRNKQIFSILDDLDKIILEYGGRIYLTKDSRLKPETFRLMYPDFQKWIDTVEKFSPTRKFSSLMAQRLKL